MHEFAQLISISVIKLDLKIHYTYYHYETFCFPFIFLVQSAAIMICYAGDSISNLEVHCTYLFTNIETIFKEKKTACHIVFHYSGSYA